MKVGRYTLLPGRVAWMIFLLVGLCCLLYLGTQTIIFIQEARVAVNIGTDSTNAPTQRIVNKSHFEAPSDGLLRLDQLEMMARIVESADSLAPTTAQSSRTEHIINLLNEYTVSLAEYRWIRSSIANQLTMDTREAKRTKSPLGRYQQVMIGVFERHRSFFRDSLDQQLL